VLGGSDLVVVKNRGLFILSIFWRRLRLYNKTVDCMALCFELRALQRMNSPSWLLWHVWGSVKWLTDAVEFGLALNSFWKSFNTFYGLNIALLSQVQRFTVVFLNKWLRLWISTHEKTDIKLVHGRNTGFYVLFRVLTARRGFSSIDSSHYTVSSSAAAWGFL